ncbi:MAG: MAPEG family protein [Alteraurantiacibacter sp.]
MNTAILAPAAALIVWSIVMLVWMAATRFPAMGKLATERKTARKSGGIARPGGRGQDLEGVIDDRVNWKSHNYTHLMEQPTLFYAVTIILAIVGATPDMVIAAWIYTGVRILHSLWQALVNTIPIRLMLFLISTFALSYLAVRALVATL